MPSLDERFDRPKVATLLGVHLVSEVLDEACTVANAAQRIGWPWTCVLAVFKDVKSGKLAVPGQDVLFEVAQGDNEILIKNKEFVPSVTTSTPHKDDMAKPKHESSFIGQGDEEFDMLQNDLNKSTSMIINNLFDMTEVDKDISTDDDKIEAIEKYTTNTEEFKQMVSNIVEVMFYNVLKNGTDTESDVVVKDKEGSPEDTCYSYLEDIYQDENGENITYYVENASKFSNNENKPLESGLLPIGTEEINELDDKIEDNDVTRYENAYLTLNRDYEQCSDEEGDHILKDPRELIMQDVELLTASTSEDNLSSNREQEEAKKGLTAVSAVSGASGSRKSKGSLVSRCRSQGARLLACLRGWWRRKTPGKRKEPRVPGSVRGICPLSPAGRRRAASLLDHHRHLYSPTPTRSVAWKFNTVSESVVNSSKWKEYTFDEKPDECGEV